MTQKNIELRARHDTDLIHEISNDLDIEYKGYDINLFDNNNDNGLNELNNLDDNTSNSETKSEK